jgi:hypothetical protein
MDGLLSVAPNCAQAVATFFHIPERSICTSKTTGWFTKGLKLINLPHANKVLLKVAHAFLYTWMDFFSIQLLS